MESGGNAVDAAIAANAVLGVVCPEACGVGGDLFALIHRPDDHTPLALNASGRAGSNIDTEEITGEIPSDHPLAVTVPGCVYGWNALNTAVGGLPLERVLQPAIDLAEQGFEVSPELSKALDYKAVQLRRRSAIADLYPNGNPAAAGTVVRRPHLADTLAAIGEEGPASFYEGRRGRALTAAVEGRITDADLERDQADWIQPLPVDTFGLQGWTIPPNSQGYLALASCRVFEMLEPPRDPADPRWWMASIEAYRVLAGERDDLVADADFAPLPSLELVSEHRLRKMADQIGLTTAGRWRTSQAAPGGTAYLCVRDQNGVGVSLIQSNFFGFGSGIEVRGAGYLLHNRGSGFTLAPGHPNRLGPGKRPLHTLSPTLWTEHGRLRALLGSRGGDFQPQLVLQLSASIFWCGLSPFEAQKHPRWVVPNLRGIDPAVTLESDAPPSIVDFLAGRGFDVTLVPPRQPGWGPVSVILDDGVRVRGAADARVSTTSIAGQP